LRRALSHGTVRRGGTGTAARGAGAAAGPGRTGGHAREPALRASGGAAV